MKTLDQIEARVAINPTNTPGDADSQFRITQAGSYYLTQNWTVGVAKHGIEVAAFPVTIDLNGYTLTSFPGSLDGVHDASGAGQIIVRNGVIREFGGAGVNIAGGLIEDVVVSGCDGDGFVVGAGASLRDCVARDNGGVGFTDNNAPGGRTLVNCVAENSDAGFVLTRATLRDCVSIDGSSSLAGFVVSNSTLDGCASIGADGQAGIMATASTLTACIVESSLAEGFDVRASTLLNCVARNNAGIGIRALGSTLSNCVADSNDDIGIQLSGGSASNCRATSNFIGFLANGAAVHDSNATSNQREGFSGSESRFTGCVASFNSEAGFLLSASTAADCSASRNTGSGFVLFDQSTAAGCVAREHTATGGTSPGGAGVRVEGEECRIEGNTLIGNIVGVQVLAPSNLVIGNRASANTTIDYAAVGGNSIGAVTGLAGATAPFDNISY
jgi:hypothetical protein